MKPIFRTIKIFVHYINENLMRSTIENEAYTHTNTTHYSNENNEGEMCLIIVKILSKYMILVLLWNTHTQRERYILKR